MIYLIDQKLDMYIYCITEPNVSATIFFKEYEYTNKEPIYNLEHYPEFKNGYKTISGKIGCCGKNRYAYTIENNLYLIDIFNRTYKHLSSNIENVLFVNNNALIKHYSDNNLYYLEESTTTSTVICNLSDLTSAQELPLIIDYMATCNGDIYLLLSDTNKYYICLINVSSKEYKSLYNLEIPRKEGITERIIYNTNNLTVTLGNNNYIIPLQ